MAAYYHVYTAMDMCQVGKTAVSIQYNFIFFLAGSCFVNKYIDPGSLVMSKHPTSPRCVLSKISRNVWIEYYTEIQKRKVMTRQTHRCADWLNKIASSFHYKLFSFVCLPHCFATQHKVFVVLHTLNTDCMLWGGVFLLCLSHISTLKNK